MFSRELGIINHFHSNWTVEADSRKQSFYTISVFGPPCCLCSFQPAVDLPRKDPYHVYSDLLRVTFSGKKYKQLIIASVGLQYSIRSSVKSRLEIYI
jgi:hypothetical protein